MNNYLISIIFLLLTCPTVYSGSVMTVDIPFKGTTSGGTLVLGTTLGKNARFISIETKAGESAETVVAHLATEIAFSNTIFEWGDDPNYELIVSRLASGNTLHLAGARGHYFFAGTENSLGIPEPSTSVSCSYDSESDQVKLNWENPPEGYDSIVIVSFWHNYDHGRRQIISGTSTDYAIDRTETPVDINDLDVRVIGIRNGIPSGSAGIYLNGNAQEELFGIPFTNGVTPNWKSWSLEKGPLKDNLLGEARIGLTAEEGNRYNPTSEPSKKPFQQILKTPVEGGTVGIWRKFLGLTPGHTYRLSARLNTFRFDPNEKDWSFSLHAVPDKPGVDKLTENQMAGLTALPNGKSGQEAGRLKVLDSTRLTCGQYDKYSADITLPEDSNSITVWLRLTGKNTNGVGFDWIRLEDLDVE